MRKVQQRPIPGVGTAIGIGLGAINRKLREGLVKGE